MSPVRGIFSVEFTNTSVAAQQGFGIVGGGSLVLAATAVGGLGTLSGLPLGIAVLGTLHFIS